MSHKSKIKNKKMRKALAFSTDFMISGFIFFAILSMTYLTWNAIESKSIAFQDYRYLSQKAGYVTEVLVRTEGYPNDWNSTNVNLPGLLDNEMYISNKKLDSLMLINLNDLKNMWGISSYNFNMTISDTSNVYFTLGETLDGSEKQVVSKSRLVIYNDSNNLIKTELQFVLWEN